MTEPQPEPENLTPVEERADELRLAALAAHGYLAPDGTILDGKIEDTLFDAVVKAEVFNIRERKTTAITRTALTRIVVPNMPGPGDYQGTDDPEAAELAWSKINAMVWRQCDSNAEGRIQQRLNGEHALILCRTTATSEKGVKGVYVTRDWACLKADWVTPDQKAVERAINRQARNAELGVQRTDHGKKFLKELNAETKNVLKQGTDRISRMIEGGTDEDDDDDA